MTPSIGSMAGRDITGEGVSACMLGVAGLPESPVGKLEFENIKASFLPEAERIPERPVMMDNFNEMTGRSVYAENVKELVLKNVEIIGAADNKPEMIGVESFVSEGVEYK